MANNVAGLTTLISSDLSRDAAAGGPTATQILYDIKASIRDYEAQRFYFNEMTVAETLSQTNCYSLPTWAQNVTGLNDIIEIDEIKVSVNGNLYRLEEIPYSRFLALTSSATLTGQPTKYAVFGRNVYTYPTPTTEYLAVLSGHVKYNEVTSQSSSNVWTDDGRELIRCATEKRLYGRLIKDLEMAQAMQMAETQALAALQRKSDAQSGHVVSGYL